MIDYQEVVKYFENKLNTGVNRNRRKYYKTAISAMQELQEYKQLGTLEEVREAVEKQKKKKPIEDRHHGIRYTEVYRCYSCNESFSGRGFAKYCYHCGQAIDWGDGD